MVVVKRFEKNSAAYELDQSLGREGNMPAGVNEKLHVTHIDVLPQSNALCHERVISK